MDEGTRSRALARKGGGVCPPPQTENPVQREGPHEGGGVNGTGEMSVNLATDTGVYNFWLLVCIVLSVASNILGYL